MVLSISIHKVAKLHLYFLKPLVYSFIFLLVIWFLLQLIFSQWFSVLRSWPLLMAPSSFPLPHQPNLLVWAPLPPTRVTLAMFWLVISLGLVKTRELEQSELGVAQKWILFVSPLQIRTGTKGTELIRSSSIHSLNCSQIHLAIEICFHNSAHYSIPAHWILDS